jgi:hypothetical protein
MLRSWLQVLAFSGLCASGAAQQPARSVDEGMSLAKARAAAAHVDELLQKGLRLQGLQPTELLDDAGFVRRAYLQIVGRTPSLTEVEGFFADQDADKRARLVDHLLDSPGHTSAIADWWFDLLRVKSRQRQFSGEPFAHWIREAVRTDMPYDQFVRAMLVASGPADKEGCGATGYLLRDANMPHDAMANTLRLFLGTRIECAQCHNHPFDHWTQKEFYQMAAFFGGLRYRTEPDRNAMAGLRSALTGSDERNKQAARRVLLTLNTGLSGSGNGVEHLPEDYKYDDARPRSPVFATTILGPKVQPPHAVPAAEPPRPRARPGRAMQPPVENDSRAAFADWLASPKNTRFVTVIVGRMWQRSFGRGLIDPVDDLKDDTKAVYPELQRYLETLLVEQKFDLRQFERVLCQTQLFQRRSPEGDPPPEQPYAFPGPLLRRFSAEQMWDSLLTLVFADVDQRIRPTDARAREAYDRYASFANSTPEQIAQLLEQGRPGAMAQRPPVTGALANDSERQQQVRQLFRQYMQARNQGDAVKVDQLAAQLRQLGAPLPGERAARGREGDLVRASDFLQPAPQGHLLRQFGQSDRETIDASNRDANVPQALTMLNGFLDQRVLNGASSLRAALTAAKTPAEQVRVAYLSTLSRLPRDDELATWRAAIAGGGDNALRDLVWVLCNSNEFRFLP